MRFVLPDCIFREKVILFQTKKAKHILHKRGARTFILPHSACTRTAPCSEQTREDFVLSCKKCIILATEQQREISTDATSADVTFSNQEPELQL